MAVRSRPRRREARARLVVVGGPGRGAHGEVSRASPKLLVGRATDAGLRVEGDARISRHHFIVEVKGRHIELVDLGSTFGTVLNGEAIDGRALLRDGDIIEAGLSRFEVAIRAKTADKTKLSAGSDPRHERVRCRVCQRVVIVERATVLVGEDGRVRQQPGAGSDFVCRNCRAESRGQGPEVRFPGYRTIEVLGEGSMGSIFLVERIVDGELFALKQLRPEANLARPDVQRFLREAASLRSLRHPNIIGFVDEGYVDGEFCFVMEYVEGVDLDLYRRQAGGRVPVRRCVDLIAQLLDGLDYAHRQGFVHRDVKPANILVGVVNGRMTPKLSDFGLAKRYQEAADTITRGHISFGTPDYMPPEQITAFKAVGPASDIYAVGATTYHLLCGVPLYHGVPGADPIRTLLERDPPPLLERAPYIPVAVAEVVDCATRRDPARRWPTARMFRDRLISALDR